MTSVYRSAIWIDIETKTDGFSEISKKHKVIKKLADKISELLKDEVKVVEVEVGSIDKVLVNCWDSDKYGKYKEEYNIDENGLDSDLM